MKNLQNMNSINKRLREIDEELVNLYREKRILEAQQQEYWREMGFGGAITNADENFEVMYGS